MGRGNIFTRICRPSVVEKTRRSRPLRTLKAEVGTGGEDCLPSFSRGPDCQLLMGRKSGNRRRRCLFVLQTLSFLVQWSINTAGGGDEGRVGAWTWMDRQRQRLMERLVVACIASSWPSRRIGSRRAT